MLSQWARRWSPKILLPVNQVLFRLGITANGLTVAGLIFAVFSGICVAVDRLALAAGFLVLSGLCDSLDGGLARFSGRQSRLGPFIDSVADHYGDFAIYFGLTWRAVHMADSLMILLVMTAMFGSLVGSHIRSRAGMVGVDTKSIGIFTRMERILVLLFGMITGFLDISIAVLALGTNISALQRVIYTLKSDG